MTKSSSGVHFIIYDFIDLKPVKERKQPNEYQVNGQHLKCPCKYYRYNHMQQAAARTSGGSGNIIVTIAINVVVIVVYWYCY